MPWLKGYVDDSIQGSTTLSEYEQRVFLLFNEDKLEFMRSEEQYKIDMERIDPANIRTNDKLLGSQVNNSSPPCLKAALPLRALHGPPHAFHRQTARQVSYQRHVKGVKAN